LDFVEQNEEAIRACKFSVHTFVGWLTKLGGMHYCEKERDYALIVHTQIGLGSPNVRADSEV
jgi:hypothetical protein